MNEMDGRATATTATPTLEHEWDVRAAPADDEWQPGTPDRRASPVAQLPDTGPEPVPSLAAIDGHPLHPAIVPLPIGAFVGAFAADVAYAVTGNRFYERAGRELARAGIVTGLLAGALGATDLLGRDRIRGKGTAWIHAGGNVAAIGLAAASMPLRRERSRLWRVPAALLASTAIVAILGVTGWLGGELAFRHRIGVTRG